MKKIIIQAVGQTGEVFMKLQCLGVLVAIFLTVNSYAQDLVPIGQYKDFEVSSTLNFADLSSDCSKQVTIIRSNFADQEIVYLNTLNSYGTLIQRNFTNYQRESGNNKRISDIISSHEQLFVTEKIISKNEKIIHQTILKVIKISDQSTILHYAEFDQQNNVIKGCHYHNLKSELLE